MNNKIYVGNLPFNQTAETIQDIFSQFGTITDKVVITDRETGRSKGFGFITFESQDSAEKAVKGMDGKEVSGRKIKVNIAHEKNDKRR